MQTDGYGCIPTNVTLFKNKPGSGFGLWAVVCQSWVYRSEIVWERRRGGRWQGDPKEKGETRLVEQNPISLSLKWGLTLSLQRSFVEYHPCSRF